MSRHGLQDWHVFCARKLHQLVTQDHPTDEQWTEILGVLCDAIDQRTMPHVLSWLQKEHGATTQEADAIVPKAPRQRGRPSRRSGGGAVRGEDA